MYSIITTNALSNLIIFKTIKMKNILLYSLLWLAIGCKSKNETETNNTNDSNDNLVSLTEGQIKNATIQLGKLEPKTISSILKVNGKIDVPPQNMISVSMPLGGYLKSTQLLPGLHLKKGEVIAQMEDQQFVQMQQDYLTTKSKLFFAEKDLERQRELNQNQASSDKIYQQAQAECANLKIALSGLSEKLKLINVNPLTLTSNKISKSVYLYSPINGFVSKVNVNIGKYVNPSDVLFELINPTDIHLNLKVYEKDLAKLYIGQNLTAFTNDNSEKKYPCEILLISKDISSEEHNAEVHCHFKNYDKNLFPGMYMNAEIEIKNNKTAALPEEAIVNFEGNNYIFIAIAKNKFRMVAVKVGTSENGFIEIQNPENFTSDQIVIKGAYTLLMKLKNKNDE